MRIKQNHAEEVVQQPAAIQQALEQYWDHVCVEDRCLMIKNDFE